MQHSIFTFALIIIINKMNKTTNTQPLDLSAVVYLALMITVFFAAV